MITYFTFVLLIYIFREASMKKADDVAMLFVYALFPAMMTYALNRFLRKSDVDSKALRMAGTD